ncbi:hypothetical protein MRB53_002033 [Persea americana]|uniref:Uncharacterized protein n=1 Tax=Persea americana TaxID=3435 RepID=A0ACC2MUA1_PERAE|nr:hypothetical protein MRB53_002033 [Persea americana]
MESTINVAFKSRKVIIIVEAALKVKLAPKIIHIAALAPPTLLFGSVSPFVIKKTPHAGGKIHMAKDTPALGSRFAPLIKSSNLKCVFKTPKIPMTTVAIMVTSDGQSRPQTQSQSKRTSEGSSSAQRRGLVVLTSKPQKKKNNGTQKGRTTISVNSIDSSPSSNSAEESSFSSNPLYDQPEAIFMEEEFLPHVHNNVSTPSSPSVSQKLFANVLVTGAEGDKTMEEIIAELQQKLNEKEAKIASLKQNPSKDRSSGLSNDNVDLNSLKDFVLRAVKEFTMPARKIDFDYQKPYPSHMDEVPFPLGYTMPKFENFDGDPSEFLAHFVSLCGDTAKNPALFLQQFVTRLKGAAFTWYSHLPAGSIVTWEDMKHAFLQHFYSINQEVGIEELTEASQRPIETEEQYISRWRDLSLRCPAPLSERQKIKLCLRGLNHETRHPLLASPMKTFEALNQRAHDLENSTLRHNKEVAKTKKVTPSQSKTHQKAPPKKEVTIVEVGKSKDKQVDKPVQLEKKKNTGKNRPSLKERMEKVYPFPNEDVEDLLGELFERNLLELPEPKRLGEVDKVDHLKFCKYHQMTNHKTVDCFVLKENIQVLIDDGTIKLAGNQTVENKATADANPVLFLEKQEWEEITTRKKKNKKSSEGKTL